MGQHLRSIDQWGDVEWKSFEYAFYNIQNLQVLATDTPNFNGMTNVSYMFSNTNNLTGNFENRNLNGVTHADGMFQYSYYFNGSVAGRDVHTVQSMNYLFAYTYLFDQDLSNWNVSNVTSASDMLSYTSLSTRNYNKLLDARAQQPVKSNVYLSTVGGYNGSTTMYGGCGVSNGPTGISGHNTLTASKNWQFNDGGLGVCTPAHYNGQLVFTREAGGGNYCINSLNGNAGGGVVVDWGDGSASVPALNGSSLCHGYAGNHNVYEVRISHPEALTSLGLNSTRVTSLSLGDGVNLTTLDISNNYNPNIWNLFSGQTNKLSNLQSLYLAYNDIVNLSPTLLSGLSSLENLFLYGNKIQTLPEGFLAFTPNLKHLDVGHNRLSTLPSGAFAGAASLVNLYLQNNQLKTISSGTFAGLNSLSHLNLSQNQLSFVETGAFSGAFNNWGYLYVEGNNLKTLPGSFPNEIGNVYVIAYNNCLDSDFLATGVQTLLAMYDWNWENNQYLCSDISYAPAKPATGTVV